jgi:hypothetical protein
MGLVGLRSATCTLTGLAAGLRGVGSSALPLGAPWPSSQMKRPVGNTGEAAAKYMGTTWIGGNLVP